MLLSPQIIEEAIGINCQVNLWLSQERRTISAQRGENKLPFWYLRECIKTPSHIRVLVWKVTFIFFLFSAKMFTSSKNIHVLKFTKMIALHETFSSFHSSFCSNLLSYINLIVSLNFSSFYVIPIVRALKWSHVFKIMTHWISICNIQKWHFKTLSTWCSHEKFWSPCYLWFEFSSFNASHWLEKMVAAPSCNKFSQGQDLIRIARWLTWRQRRNVNYG